MRHPPSFLICTCLLLALWIVGSSSLGDESLLSPQELAQALAAQPQVSLFLPAAGLRAGTNCTVVAAVANRHMENALTITPVPRIHPADKLPPLAQPPTQVVAVLLWPASSDSQPATRPALPRSQLGAPLTIPSLGDGLFEVAVPGTLLHEGDYWIQAVMLVGEEDVAHSPAALIHVRSAPPTIRPK